MRKNTYKNNLSITQRVLDHLKELKIDSKSVLLGVTMAAVAGSSAPGVFASFADTDNYKSAIKEVATEEMRTSANFFAARFGMLPDDFNEWGMADESGWTIAHEAALYGHLPDGFEHVEMADRVGETVAQALKRGARASASVERMATEAAPQASPYSHSTVVQKN